MKKLLVSLLICSLLFLIACSKSDSGTSNLSSQPEASASDDGKSGGVYKGVLVGSSGTVKIILQGGTVSAEVTIDGKTKILPATNLPAGWTSGQSLINIVFAKDNWTLSFSVSPTGYNPQIFDVSIPGHTNIEVYVIKEKSTLQVKAYEGTYGKGSSFQDQGTWNLVMSTADTTFGIYTTSRGKLPMRGSFAPTAGSLQLFGSFEAIRAEGRLENNTFTGTWTKSSSFGDSIPPIKGKWRARRTL